MKLKRNNSSYLVADGNAPPQYPAHGNRSQTPEYKSKKGNSSLICSHCMKVGHTVDKSYRIIGFPSDLKFTKSKRDPNAIRSNVVLPFDLPCFPNTLPNFAGIYGNQLTHEQVYQLVHLLNQDKITQPYANPVDQSAMVAYADCLLTVIAIYVDEIVIKCDYATNITQLKLFLDAEFKVKDFEFSHYFLGLEVFRETQGLIVTQRNFSLELLSDFECEHLPLASSPFFPSIKVSARSGELLTYPTTYRRLIGKLNYLTHTRPDLLYVVQHLSQFMQKPRLPHFDATLHVVRYLRLHPGQGLFFTAETSVSLLAYCDADWGSCIDSRRSVSGYHIILGSSPISWKSKKLHSVSLSSAEAEYRSMRCMVAELTWLNRLLHDLGVPPTLLVHVHSDSQAAIHIAKNPFFHKQTKHLELDCHFLVDLLTKPLSGPSHHTILGKLGLVSPPSILRGGVENDNMNQHCIIKEHVADNMNQPCITKEHVAESVPEAAPKV
uniref:Reverse transcriptase Ty1/copia-type domain-containing protein n=1 Tax=Solanum lycopersicum TaxID=4081 RepID=A0A3Q7JBS0_SOLLC